jgi:hypothetical protein
MVCYDLQNTVTDAMTAVLASNAVYQYWYPSYTSFMGQPVTGNKTGTTRISISTSSLEMLIGTFMVQNRDTPNSFLIGDYNSYYIASAAKDEYGSADLTFRNANFRNAINVNQCVLTKLNILYVMELHQNNVDGLLVMYTLIMKLYPNNLAMY